MFKDPKHLWNLHESTFIIFKIISGWTDLENISLSDMQNLRGVSKHIDFQWQVSCSGLWEFAAPDSNAIIFKAEIFFLNFSFYF